MDTAINKPTDTVCEMPKPVLENEGPPIQKAERVKFCEVCGKLRTRRGSKGRFCSCKCYGEWMRSQKSIMQENLVEYTAWLNMRSRCHNKKRSEYKDYGGRGIKIDERWNNFENFFSDMGKRPSDKHTIERIDNNGNYSPQNVCWATRERQTNNRRVTVFLTHNGKTMCLRDWAKEKGINYHTLLSRVFICQWDDEKILTTPVREMRKPVCPANTETE
jgi:hypothetical protein